MATTKSERVVTLDWDELQNFSETVCELVPLSQRDVSVLVSCLRVAHWVARWFAGDKLLRDLGRFTDIEDALTYIEQLEGKLLMTGCLEGLISVMGEIRDALKASAACCQSTTNGVRMVDLGEGELVYGTQQPLEPPTSFGGEGEFENEEAYEAHRCNAANNIVSGLILSLNSWSALSLASLLVGSIVVGIFVANPPLGVLLALAAAGFAYGVLLTISNYIADNRQGWVCAIYNAEDYQGFLASVDSKISDLVIALDIGAFEVEVTELIHSTLDTDTFNKMFTPIGLPEVQDAIDCSECAEECTFAQSAVYGTFVSENRWSSVDRGDGTQTIVVRFVWTGGSYGETCADLPAVDYTIISSLGDVRFRLFDTTGTEIYDSTTIPDGEVAFEAYMTSAAGAFTIEVAEI